MLAYQGSEFISEEWKYNCEIEKNSLHHTRTESHNSLSSGEPYHGLLRRVHSSTINSHPGLIPDISLSLTVRAINYSVGPTGLGQQILMFGELPRIQSNSTTEFPSQTTKMRSLTTSKDDYEKLLWRQLIDIGL